MEPLVKLENVCVTYNKGQGAREVCALKNVSLEIFPQEYIIFFGPSGCGKSTLLNVIAGLERISEGRAEVAGNDISKLNDEDLSTYHRHQVGYIFQSYNLISTLSVLENIALPQFFDGVPKRRWIEAARAMAARFGIADQINRLPSELSGGQQQRVGVARSLVNNPAILLADEPAGNLDSKNTALVLDIFQDLNIKEKKTILLVTHSPSHLGDADRVYYIKDGEIVEVVQNPKRVLNRDAEEAGIGEKKTTLPWKKLLQESVPVPESAKMQLLSHFILTIPNEKKMDKVRELIEKRFQEQISTQVFVSLLDVPLSKGGAGIDFRQAKSLGHTIEQMIDSGEAVRRLGSAEPDHARQLFTALVFGIDAALNLKLGRDKKAIFQEIVKNRLLNRIQGEDVREALDKAIEAGGLGLRRQTAEKVRDYLELVILVANKKQN